MKKHSEAFLRLVDQARKDIDICSVESVRARLESGDKINLIDVREDHEWTDGRIPTAQHIGKGIIERDIESHYPNYETELVLYCGGGYRSALAAQSLKKMGYANVFSMELGYKGWLETGSEIEK